MKCLICSDRSMRLTLSHHLLGSFLHVTCSHSEDLLNDSLEQVHINDSSVCVSLVRSLCVWMNRNVHVSLGCMCDLFIGKQVVSLQTVEDILSCSCFL